MLDNILEESVDQHFHSLIQTRHMQRRRDVVDDNLAAEVIEEMGDNMLEPPEVTCVSLTWYLCIVYEVVKPVITTQFTCGNLRIPLAIVCTSCFLTFCGLQRGSHAILDWY